MTEEELDLDYLRSHLRDAHLTPVLWDGEDRNMRAFRSKEELIEWYGQPPGKVNQPYRDRAFYTRELAHVSRVVQPQTIVEYGTCQGIGTCLLRWLNPTAKLTTVDVSGHTFLPGDARVEIGYLSKIQQIDCRYIQCNSWEYNGNGVDLCFIDADHSYGSVVLDSATAWRNRSQGRAWAIVWHDYNDRHPGVVHAVEEFCQARKLDLQSRSDSDTVWVTGDK